MECRNAGGQTLMYRVCQTNPRLAFCLWLLSSSIPCTDWCHITKTMAQSVFSLVTGPFLARLLDLSAAPRPLCMSWQHPLESVEEVYDIHLVTDTMPDNGETLGSFPPIVYRLAVLHATYQVYSVSHPRPICPAVVQTMLQL